MATATAKAFINEYHPQKDGKCSVTIRVTYQRKKKYYPTGISLLSDDFRRLFNAKRRNDSEKAMYNRILAFETKANQCIDSIGIFTFSRFEESFLQNREAADSIKAGFDRYIAELKNEDRIGTAVSYECARNNFESFKPGLKYVDVTKAILSKYVEWMSKNGKSQTTTGIYLRSLRAIFNRAKIDKSIYPFKDFTIPSGRNIKKALTIEEIGRIFEYPASTNTSEEMAKDYWIFSYLCNGLNVKDLCLLKRKDIAGDILTFERAKTKRSKKAAEKITVSFKPEAKAIVLKHGIPSVDPGSFIFPHLKKGMTAEQQRNTIQLVTRLINKYMKRIADKLGIEKNVTTYFARHSFATILKRSGAPTEFISDALGHSDLKTTKSYLAGFEEKAIHETTDALTAFKN
ncbi:site-specific integrase [Pollutibacter soli]|uniref:site-specific integrase n=1 Tax=Pollutibacter soli TaxID=3034157 RepID=UPI003014014C